MENTDLWTKFEKTGCIVDYLSYKGFAVEEKESEPVDCSDRDDTVRSTNR